MIQEAAKPETVTTANPVETKPAIAWRIAPAIVLIFAISHFWSVRYEMNPDGVSYVDVARRMAAGDWANARNSTWSPLFPALTAAMLKLRGSNPTLGSEWVAAHVAGLLLFVLALFAFGRFWRLAGNYQDALGLSLPSAWPCLGYLLFATTFIPTLDVLTPDLGVAAVVLGAAAFLITFHRSPVSYPQAASFGAMLGLGYLDKAVMFPVGCIAMASLGLSQLVRRRAAGPVFLAGLTFLGVCSPLIWVTSKAEGKLTFGEAGRLAYAFNVNDYNFDANTKIPIGPKIAELPALYKVPLRPGITFSPWYDPAVLGKEIKGKMHFREQLQVLYGNYKILRDLFLVTFGVLALAWLLLLSLGSRRRAATHWPVLAVAFVGLSLYSAVLIETRYIGAFVLLVLGGLLGGVTVNADKQSVRAARITLAAATSILAFLALPSLLSYLDSRARPNPQLELARWLKTEERLPDESAIGVLGDPRWQFWPQALHWRIAAVVPRKQIPEFLSLPSLEQHRILRMFELAGAKIVIAELNQATAPDGCKRIGQMPYCIFDLSDSNGH